MISGQQIGHIREVPRALAGDADAGNVGLVDRAAAAADGAGLSGIGGLSLDGHRISGAIIEARAEHKGAAR